MTPYELATVSEKARKVWADDEKQLAIFTMLQALLQHEHDKEAYGRSNGEAIQCD